MSSGTIKPYFHILKNGMTIVILDWPHLKTTEITLGIKSGKLYEDPEDLGVTHFIEHLLFGGTQKYPTKEILRDAARKIGTHTSASTAPELTQISISSLNQNFQKALEIIFEMSQKALFLKKDILLEKNIVLEERKRSLDTLERMVRYHLLPKTIFDDLIYTLPGLGEESTIKNFNRNQILNYYKKFYIPSNMIIGVNTSLPKDLIIKLVEERFGKIENDKTKNLQSISKKVEKEKVILEKKSTNRLHVGLGVETFPFNHPDRYALEILRNIVRLNLLRTLNSKLGLVYGVGINTLFFPEKGALLIQTATDKKNSLLIIQSIFNVLKDTKKSVGNKDFINEKVIFKTSLLQKEESPSKYIRELIYQKLYSDTLDSIEDKIKKVDEVQKRDVLRVANDLLDGGKMGFVFVGDIDPNLEKNILKFLKNNLI